MPAAKTAATTSSSALRLRQAARPIYSSPVIMRASTRADANRWGPHSSRGTAIHMDRLVGARAGADCVVRKDGDASVLLGDPADRCSFATPILELRERRRSGRHARLRHAGPCRTEFHL